MRRAQTRSHRPLGRGRTGTLTAGAHPRSGSERGRVWTARAPQFEHLYDGAMTQGLHGSAVLEGSAPERVLPVRSPCDSLSSAPPPPRQAAGRAAPERQEDTRGFEAPTRAGGDLVARVEAVRAQLAELVAAADGAGALQSDERRAVWVALGSVDAALTAARAAWLAADEAAGTIAGPSDVSTAAAVARLSRSSMGDAHRQVRQARTLHTLPDIRDAVSRGRVPVGHLDVLARVLERASEPARAAVSSPRGQATVRRLAERSPVNAFARELEQWVAAVDPAGLEADHAAQRRERFLTLSHQRDGVRLTGRLDRIAGEYLHRALDLVGEPLGDDRTPEQARADALEALARQVLAAPDQGTSGASVRPHVTLVMDATTFAAARTEIARRRGELARVGASGAPASPVVVAPATTQDGVPVPMSEVARMLCDADVSRLVVGERSEPLDLGRAVRVYTGAQRRAVIARDQFCGYPACGKPARWCEVHHLDWWSRDEGATSVANGVLLCVHHHHLVHALDLSVSRRAPAPGAPPGCRPRPGYDVRRRDGTPVDPASTRAGGSSLGGVPPAPDTPPAPDAAARGQTSGCDRPSPDPATQAQTSGRIPPSLDPPDLPLTSGRAQLALDSTGPPPF